MSDFLAGAGVVIAAGASAAAILLPGGSRARAAAMLLALVLFPALILGDQWHARAIVDLRTDAARLAALALLALAVSGGLALVFRRWPLLLPLAIVATLPFRIPLHAGGDTANLLVPLYLVIAGGVLSAVSHLLLRESGAASPAASAGATGAGALAPPGGGVTGPPGRGPYAWLPRILAAVVVLYALQTLYSPDFSKSLQNVCFFFVPFSLVYALLRDVEWDRRLLGLVLWVVAAEALAFVAVGTVEYLTRSLFWNDQVIRSDEFHTYFRVNSVFWDPNIYGRYLSLAIVLAMTVLLWARERRDQALLAGLVAILWIGLFPTFSQSSFAALLAGLAVLAALRWSVRWTLAAVAAAILAGLAVIALAGGAEKLSPDRINIDLSGRGNLISGGIHLFAQRPIYGYGAGSFPKAYREHVRTRQVPVSISHTEPITVAAEQGLIGIVAYLALLAVALATMWTAVRRSRSAAAPAAVLALFVALLVHTMAYAGFFEDPITWVLMAAAAALAAAPVRDPA
jgi:O-antigen ligase